MSRPTVEISAARRLVDSVVRGAITPQNDPAIFEDDVLLHRVFLLEREDSSWLLERLRKGPSTEDGLLQMSVVISPKLRQDAGLPDPVARILGAPKK